MVELESFLSYGSGPSSGDSSSSGDRRRPSAADAVVDERPTDEPGSRVGRYVLGERLGAGGMGIVHAAWDPELDRRVAIKLIRRGRQVSPELLRRRLRREAQAMARLRHPNVVAVYDVGESDGQLFVAMEYVDGTSVRKWLRAKTRSVADILEVFRAAGEGLAAAHAEGLIHRDFKPDNVLVARDGRVLVLDFGLASWATSPAGDSSDNSTPPPAQASPEASGSSDHDETLTKTGAVLGTPNYMAPEQRRGHTLDARSDQFAFCVALWQALSDELPYGQSSPRALARARLGRLGKLPRKGVPARVERAMRRGLAWNPDDRWPDMRALLDALAQPNHRWWWAAVPVTLAAGLAVWSLDGETGALHRSCSDQSERASEVWNLSTSTALAEVFAARSEFAKQSWPLLRGQLDRWIENWTAIDLELCNRYGFAVASQLHEGQLLCLDRQLDQFALAVRLLEGVTAAEVERSFELLSRLPDPATCRETALPEASVDVDPQLLAEQEAKLHRADLEEALGRIEAADESSGELLAATNGPGFEHLHVRVAELRSGLLADKDRRDEAIDVAFSGLAAAERNGAAPLRLRAFNSLLYVHVRSQDLPGAKRWLAQANTIATGREFDRDLLREIATNSAWVATLDGRFDEALAEFDRAIALTDAETRPREHADLIISRAQVLGWNDQPKQALEQFTMGMRELILIIGPEHPYVLELRLANARIMMQLEQFEAAREESLVAAASLEALRGPTTTSVAARVRAASILDRLGDCAGATAEFEPLIPLGRETMPPLSPDLGEMLTMRAELCDYETPEAIDFAREALALYREAVGDQHVIVASARTLLARTYYESGALEQAREEVEMALSIFAAVDPIGAQFVPEARALAMVVRHELGEPTALDGIEELIARLPKKSVWVPRLEALR